jgi:hypothetical protein
VELNFFTFFVSFNEVRNKQSCYSEISKLHFVWLNIVHRRHSAECRLLLEGEMLIGRGWVAIALMQAVSHFRLCLGRFHPVVLSQKQHLDLIKIELTFRDTNDHQHSLPFFRTLLSTNPMLV